MPRPAAATRSRRTQEQRSSEMRARLLDATIDCLVQYGYAGTTTPRVAEHAGVTRGAQVHHFGSKQDLVVAAISRLAERRIAALLPEMERAAADDDVVGAVLDLLWDVHQGPLYVALVELWLAGRTDPQLAAELRRVEPVVNNAMLGAVAQLVPNELVRKPARDFIYTAMDALRGILLSTMVADDPERAHRRWQRASADLRIVGERLLSGLADPD
ncbi:TetR/AcrR family transcriptional regulator [Nocardia thailandica]